MIDFSAPIVPGRSIGNIALLADIQPVLSEAYERCLPVRRRTYPQNPVPAFTYGLCDDTVRLATFDDVTIVGITCNHRYGGCYLEHFRPGMQCGEVLALCASAHITNGYLILNEEYGGGFVIPDFYDFDHVREIPDDLVLDEIFVRDIQRSSDSGHP